VTLTTSPSNSNLNSIYQSANKPKFTMEKKNKFNGCSFNDISQSRNDTMFSVGGIPSEISSESKPKNNMKVFIPHI